MFSRQDQPGVLIKALRYAHDYTSQISWHTVEAARHTLEATHAFDEPNSADRLVLPGLLRRLDPSAPTRRELLRQHVPSNGIEL